MYSKQKGVCKYRKIQTKTRNKRISQAPLLITATLLIVILVAVFLAFRNLPPPTDDLTDPLSQLAGHSTPAAQNIAYQELHNFPPRGCHISIGEDYPGPVIATQQEYDQLTAKFISRTDECKRARFPNINFARNILLFYIVQADVPPHCDDILTKNAFRDEKTKKILFTATVYYRCNFDFFAIKSEAVLLPKLPGYTVDFTVTKIPRSGDHELRKGFF